MVKVGVGVFEGVTGGDGVDMEDVNVWVGSGVLRVIELLEVVIKPALSFIWQ